MNGWLWPGYVLIGIANKNRKAHSLAWLYVHGEWPENEIDHIDGNGLNNRIDNLREVTTGENKRNKRLQKNNTSKCVGIYWYKPTKKRAAKECINGLNKHLGYFKEKWDAICARKSSNNRNGFHPNHGSPKPRYG